MLTPLEVEASGSGPPRCEAIVNTSRQCRSVRQPPVAACEPTIVYRIERTCAPYKQRGSGRKLVGEQLAWETRGRSRCVRRTGEAPAGACRRRSAGRGLGLQRTGSNWCGRSGRRRAAPGGIWDERPRAGPIMVRVGGRCTIGECLVEAPGSAVRIGSMTLSSLDLVPDPVTCTLRPGTGIRV